MAFDDRFAYFWNGIAKPAARNRSSLHGTGLVFLGDSYPGNYPAAVGILPGELSKSVGEYEAVGCGDCASCSGCGPKSVGLPNLNFGVTLSHVGAAAAAYHGYKRGGTVKSALIWGLLGGLAPIITNAVAVAQGFGQRKGGGGSGGFLAGFRSGLNKSMGSGGGGAKYTFKSKK